MNAIGRPISRSEGRLKITGGARYTADIPIAGAGSAFSTTPQSIHIAASAFDTLGAPFEKVTVHIASANRASLIGADIALGHRPGAGISMVHTTAWMFL